MTTKEIVSEVVNALEQGATVVHIKRMVFCYADKPRTEILRTFVWDHIAGCLKTDKGNRPSVADFQVAARNPIVVSVN
jgi:hypothetical protein